MFSEVWSFTNVSKHCFQNIEKNSEFTYSVITFWQAHVSEFCWRWKNQSYSFHKYYLRICISPELCQGPRRYRDESPQSPPAASQYGGDRLEHHGLPFRIEGGWAVRWRKTSRKGQPVFVTPLLPHYLLISRCFCMSRIAWSAVSFCWVL